MLTLTHDLKLCFDQVRIISLWVTIIDYAITDNNILAAELSAIIEEALRQVGILCLSQNKRKITK